MTKLPFCIAVISLAAVFFGVLSCVGSHRHASSSVIPRTGADFDRDFLTDTITHHEIAAGMLANCLQKSGRAELTALCQDLATVQQAQMGTMQAWLADWYGVQPYQSTGAAGHMSAEYRSFLEKVRTGSGEEFEEAFLRGMRLHHRQGLVESKLCQQRAAHTVLKDFCGQLTLQQQQDMQRVGNFICQWYKDCLGKDEAQVDQPTAPDLRLSRRRTASQSPSMTRPILTSETARPFRRTSRSFSAASPVS